MTRLDAIRTLIRHTAANVGGGPLAHDKLTARQEEQAIEAIKILWTEAGHPWDEKEGLRNLGLRQ